MKLTPAEETLIKTLREIDRRNPAGIDGFTTASHLAMCQTIATGGAQEGGRLYQLFIKQARKTPIVNLWEIQRQKAAQEIKPQQGRKNPS